MALTRSIRLGAGGDRSGGCSFNSTSQFCRRPEASITRFGSTTAVAFPTNGNQQEKDQLGTEDKVFLPHIRSHDANSSYATMGGPPRRDDWRRIPVTLKIPVAEVGSLH